MMTIKTIDDVIQLKERVDAWKLYEEEGVVIIFPLYSKRYEGTVRQEGAVEDLRIIIEKETMLFSSQYSAVVLSGNEVLFESQPGDKAKLKEAYNKINLEFLYQRAKQTTEAARLATFKNE